MATVRLTDVIIPEIYLGYQAVNSPEKTAIYESGVIARNAILDQKARSAGEQVHLPYWNDLDASIEPNLSNTDPADRAVPNKISTGKMIAQTAFMNQSYSSADLVAELAGASPMAHIRNRFGTYWMRQWQKRLISTLTGIYADNLAANSGDMVLNIASESIAGQSATTKFNLNSFIDAAHTMGDMAEDLSAIMVHSRTRAQMLKNNDIEFIPDSQGRLVIPVYQGLRVIVDDNMPTFAGTTNGVKYMSILFANGAIGYGESVPDNAVETDHDMLGGKGGGISTIIERKTWLIHPEGFSVTAQGAAETGAHTLAELASAATWERKLPRKMVRMAYFIHN